MAAAMSAAVLRRFSVLTAALAALTYLVVMLITGALPERRHLIRFEAQGVMELAPERVTRVAVIADGTRAAYVREAGGWAGEGDAPPMGAPLAATLDRAVKFMHTAKPVRVLKAEEIAHTDLAEFGLDRPSVSITLESAGGVVLEASFGRLSNDELLQYMRLKGRDQLYLMSGFVGREWAAVADATAR